MQNNKFINDYEKKIVLETGEEYFGYNIGADKESVCELVFTTSMVGYQELIADPANADQAVVTTYPLIGNYGVSDDDLESRTSPLGALIVRECNDFPSNFRYTSTLSEVLEEFDIPGIAGVDTRKLTRRIRDLGSCRVIITSADTPYEEALAKVRAAVIPTDSVSRVSCKKKWYSRTPNHRYNIVVIDCGLRLNIVRTLNSRGCNVTVVPYNASFEEIDAVAPDGIVISNGPGNPKDIPETVETVRQLIGKFPMCGIGLGHQIIALAYGGDTYKLKFGHRGSNHPVRNTLTDKLEITGQNHSYAVSAESLADTRLEITYINLLDNSVEGIRNVEDRVFAVQFVPDTTSAPQENVLILEDFVKMIEDGGNRNA